MPKRAKPSQEQEVTWQADVPYNDQPPLPPPQDLESKAILKKCIPARAALAELKQAAMRIPPSDYQ